MWRTGWGQVSGVGRTAEDILGEGCGGLDGGQVSGEWDEQPKRSWEKDVGDWMGASVWKVGRTAKVILGEGCGGLDVGKSLESGTNSQSDLGRRVWRTGWGASV